VVLLWLVAALLAFGGLRGAGGADFSGSMRLPQTESRRGFDLIGEHFGGRGGGDSGRIVIRAADVRDPRVRLPLGRYFAQLKQIPSVTLTNPYEPASERQIAPGDRIAYAELQTPEWADDGFEHVIADRVESLRPSIPGVQIELGGNLFWELEAPSSELLGVGFAIVILVLAFGSVLAMGLPLAVAFAGIVLGALSVSLLSHIMSMPDFATTLGVMLGLGVGIDYALFIVTRFRENLHAGKSVEDAVAGALDTSGRAVAFAGVTVVVSLLGMLLIGLPFISGLGSGAAVVVAMTMVASLTLLPALLGFTGPRVERTRWRGLVATGLVAVSLVGMGLELSPLLLGLPLAVVVLAASAVVRPLRAEVRRRPPKPLRETWSYRWSRIVQHHPWRAALGSTAVLVLLAVPLFGLRIGFTDQGNDPPDTTTRKAYDLLAEGFGRGFNGPLAVVTALPDGPSGVQRVTRALQQTPGILFASPAVFDDDANPRAALWHVIPDSGPQDEATSQLVHRLRDDVLPEATADSTLRVAVTGGVAADIDFSDYVASRLWWFFSAVLAISFLLLLVVFRSVLVPVKAVIMNLLSIGAAYGVTVAVFQWGWAGGIFNVDGGPIEPFVPMMLFAIVFGLSMDYEVFLLSRIREEWERTGDTKTSVADGLAATARVITAAAAIMVFVFGSFLLESNRVVKVMGTALAVAVFLDATIVRMVLVPATMELLGERNWWFPRWLERLVPKVDLEGDSGVHHDLDGAGGAVAGDSEGLGRVVEGEPVRDERGGDVSVARQHGGDLVDLTDPAVPLVGHRRDPGDLLDESDRAGNGDEAVVDAEQDHAATGPDQLGTSG